MAKGVSIKFKSYGETVPALLELLKLQKELKKYDKIVLKPTLANSKEESTPPAFVEQVLRFCIINKNPSADIFIAEGADGEDTEDLFESFGYRKLAEKYDVALIDLNNAETEEVENDNFLRFAKIHYPKILLDSFIISLPKLAEDEETGISGSLSTMLGAFPSSLYKGFFSRKKSKIRHWPIENSIYDVNQCKTPNFAVVDASEKGFILAGIPLEIDKQAAKLLGKEWNSIPYLKLFEKFSNQEPVLEKETQSV